MPPHKDQQISEHSSSSAAVLTAVFSVAAVLIIFFLYLMAADEIVVKTAFVAGAAAIGIFGWLMSRKSIDAAAAANETTAARTPATAATPEPAAAPDDLTAELTALEEAGLFFRNSLNAGDLYRLILSRIQPLLAHESSELYTAAGGVPVQATGERILAENFHRVVTPGDRPSIIELMPPIDGFRSLVNIPLRVESGESAVLRLYSRAGIAASSETTALLDSIAAAISPALVRAITADAAVAVSMADPITGLPNERSFFMILENQLAESHRYRDDRPLTILSADIQNFDGINFQFGHAAGDRALHFVGGLIAKQLRRMDFLSRGGNDEFMMVLPTANTKTAEEIAARIREAFAATPFEISEKNSIHIGLNFGSATFWQDGETPERLLQAARDRRSRSKGVDQNKVIFFPRDYLN